MRGRGCCNWAESRPLFFCWRALRDWRASISRSIRSRSNPGRPGRKYFVGMPIPAGAGAVAAVVHLVNGEPLQWWPLSIRMGGLASSPISFLMVSTWRFFSLKGVNFREQQNFRWLIGLGALIALIWFASQYALFVLALLYILSGVLARLSFLFRRSSVPHCSSARRGFARIMKNDPKTSPASSGRRRPGRRLSRWRLSAPPR